MLAKQLLSAFSLVLIMAGAAHADLNAYIHSLNVSAEADIGDYKTRLGVHYGASGPSLDLLLRSVDCPAEASVILWLGQHSRQPVETVLQVYQARKGQGWGTIAKSLGIKPGSPEFHALKAGDLGWYPGETRTTRVIKAKGRRKKKGRK